MADLIPPANGASLGIYVTSFSSIPYYRNFYPPLNRGQQRLGMLVAFVRPSVTFMSRSTLYEDFFFYDSIHCNVCLKLIMSKKNQKNFPQLDFYFFIFYFWSS